MPLLYLYHCDFYTVVTLGEIRPIADLLVLLLSLFWSHFLLCEICINRSACLGRLLNKIWHKHVIAWPDWMWLCMVFPVYVKGTDKIRWPKMDLFICRATRYHSYWQIGWGYKRLNALYPQSHSSLQSHPDNLRHLRNPAWLPHGTSNTETPRIYGFLPDCPMAQETQRLLAFMNSCLIAPRHQHARQSCQECNTLAGGGYWKKVILMFPRWPAGGMMVKCLA